MRHTVGIVAIALACAVAPHARAQSATTGVIRGDVVSVGRPLANANVVVVGARVGGLTDSLGRFVIERVPVGTHSILVRQIGYEKRDTTVAIVAGENPPLHVELVDPLTRCKCQPCFWVNPYQGKRALQPGTVVDYTGEDWTASASGKLGGMTISSDPDPCRLHIDYTPHGKAPGELRVVAADGQTVQTFECTRGSNGIHVFWDGTSAKTPLPFGTYRVLAVSARDTLALEYDRVEQLPPH